jgi:thiamine-monophosphate kinase
VALTEFEIIRRYFARAQLAFARDGVVLGPGDDCALLALPPGEELAISIDTLNVGVHFPKDADPFLLAQRCLLVNLSDLAAMGAEPVGFTLALSLPTVDENWISQFSNGLAKVAQSYQCSLLGGDTTKGALSITIQVHGRVPARQSLRRKGARVGDRIYVSGTLGDAAAALCWMQNRSPFRGKALDDDSAEFFRNAFYRPQVSIEAGISLRRLASAALDISDGLASDLGHILEAGDLSPGSQTQNKASGRIGAVLDVHKLPLSVMFLRYVPPARQLALALAGGDDYGLCVTVAPALEAQAVSRMQALGIEFTCVGQIEKAPGIRMRDAQGVTAPLTFRGYQHFGVKDG